MCMIDDADPMAFCLTEVRTARKTHVCGECKRTIQPKERYNFASYKHPDWDRPESSKTCSHCQVATNWLYKHCDGACFGEVKSDLIEHYDSGYREDNLQKIVIGIRRQWKAFHGNGLLPLPTQERLAIAF